MPTTEAIEKLRRSKVFIGSLVLVTALGPGSMSIFIPALPAMQADFGVSASVVQLAMSLSMLAMAFATLIYGRMSDRYGRKPVLLAGLGLAVVGSLMCALAPNVWLVILGRIVQASGSTAGVVLSRAIVQDVYGEERAASVLGYLTAAMMVAPMIGPTIGGVLTDLIGWRANFSLVLVLALIVAAVVSRTMCETLPASKRDTGRRSVFQGYLVVMSHVTFWRYTLFIAFGGTAFFALLGGGPYVMANVFGRPAVEFGLYFILPTVSAMAGNLLAARFSSRAGGMRLIWVGSIGACISVFIMIVLLSAGLWIPAAIFVPAMLFTFANGLAVPNAAAGATAAVPELAGTASGLFGFFQTLMSAIIAQTVAVIFNGTPYPMVGLMMMMSLAGLLVLVMFANGRGTVQSGARA